MKNEKIISGLVAVFLSVLLAMAGIVCIVTGFSSVTALGTFAPDTSIPALLGRCCLIALCAAVCFSCKKGYAVFFAASAVVIGYNLHRGQLLLSLEALLYKITKIYSMGYGWGYIRWSDEPLNNVSLDPALTLLAAVIIAIVCFTVCCRRWFGLGAIAAIAPMGLCCVVTDTVPCAEGLAALIFGLVLLVLTQQIRRRSSAEGNRLVALLLIPAVLFTALVFRLAPQKDYQQQAQSLQDSLLELVERLTGLELFPSDSTVPSTPSLSPGTPAQVNLSQTGPLQQSSDPLIYLNCTRNGILYLRGQAYDLYTGTSWKSNTDTTAEGGWPTGGLEWKGRFELTMRYGGIATKYFPYYFLEDNWTDSLINGALENPLHMRRYTFEWYTPTDNVTFTPLSEAETAVYLALPEDTMTAARQIVDGLFDGQDYSDAEKAAIIEDFVRSSASYDLNTAKMPADSTDFALWFLNESDTGYCVHFASAATVLLRAAGIPARYVTGYLCYATSARRVSLSEEQAHAWVEYLNPDQGWTVLEATPDSDPTPVETQPPTTDPSQTTLPTETEPTVESNETTLPTLPTQTAVPTSTPTSTATTQPGGNQSSDPQWNLTWLKYVLWVLGIWALTVIQHRLRCRHRTKKLKSGTANQQALLRWRYVRRAARLLKLSPPEHLQELAEKAMFSQHTLTAAELAQFDLWLRDAKQQLKQKPLPIRWLQKLIFAIP